jgi:hypothetical protein
MGRSEMQKDLLEDLKERDHLKDVSNTCVAFKEIG